MKTFSTQEIKFVPKGWGFEKWIVNCDEYCGKLLYFVKGKKCSWHYHKLKDEYFYVQSGLIKVYYSDEDDIRKSKTVILSKDRYNKLGYVLHPDFSHVYCDNFHSWISHRDDIVIQRKDILFEHLHPSLGKSKPDEYYLKASTHEEYYKGEKIFFRLVKENFNKQTENFIFKKYKMESSPFKKYIFAYVLINTGFDEKKLLN